MKDLNDFWKALVYFVLALLFVLSAVFLSSLIGGKDKPLGTPPPPPVSIEPSRTVSCYPDILLYGQVDKKVKLISTRINLYAATVSLLTLVLL